MLLCPFKHFDQAPAFVLADRPCLHDSYGVPFSSIVLLIMNHELRGSLNELAVDRVLDLTLDRNKNALVHFVADNRPDPLLS